MFTVSGLPNTGPFDFYRGTGAPIFRTFQTSTTRTSAPAWRVLSNLIRYKFVITRTVDVSTFLWTNPTGSVLGSQEITIDFNTFETLQCGSGSAVVLKESADGWINDTSIARLTNNYSIINKVMVGGIVFERFIGDLSPVTLPEGYFEYQKDAGTLRFQTPSDTLWLGNQPIKIYGSASLGAELDANTSDVVGLNTVIRSSGIEQGLYQI